MVVYPWGRGSQRHHSAMVHDLLDGGEEAADAGEALVRQVTCTTGKRRRWSGRMAMCEQGEWGMRRRRRGA